MMRGIYGIYSLAGLVLVLLVLLAGASGCQRRAAPRAVASALTAVARLSPRVPPPAGPVALPDSLVLTPVPAPADVPDTLRRAIAELRTALGPEADGLRPAVLEQACIGYLALRRTHRIERGGFVAVADMDLPNTTERLWVLDLKNAKILHHSLVAHGEGSGHLRARRFSNKEESACTSLGFYRTAGSYDGIHGYSRRLEGLDKGENANAYNRYVVLHAADYASPAYARQHGHLGYSRGCPALPPEQFKAIISTVQGGTTLLLSGPGLHSRWLDGPVATRRFLAHGWG